MLKSVRNFRVRFVVTSLMITFLIGAVAALAALSVPNIAYSQSFPSVPPGGGINNANNNNKAVILTFDDGYKSQYTNAKPILDKYGYKATFYIICNNVGGGEGLVNPNIRMTWEDIIALYNEGHDIGS